MKQTSGENALSKITMSNYCEFKNIPISSMYVYMKTKPTKNGVRTKYMGNVIQKIKPSFFELDLNKTKSIDLYHVKLERKDETHLFRRLASMPRLKEIDLSSCDFSVPSLRYLFNHSKSIRTVKILNNSFILSLIPENSKIEIVSTNTCLSLQRLKEILNQFPNLKQLDFYYFFTSEIPQVRDILFSHKNIPLLRDMGSVKVNKELKKLHNELIVKRDVHNLLFIVLSLIANKEKGNDLNIHLNTGMFDVHILLVNVMDMLR